MTPETGNMNKTIPQSSGRVVASILERQEEFYDKVGALEKEYGTGIREELGYSKVYDAQTGDLTNTRVLYVKSAVRPDFLKDALPLSKNSENTTRRGREKVAEIIAGKDDRLIVVVGPCSIHNPEEALEYADWISEMRETYGENLEIVMRAYLEKPRTAEGWKGLINDPGP